MWLLPNCSRFTSHSEVGGSKARFWEIWEVAEKRWPVDQEIGDPLPLVEPDVQISVIRLS
jgi:hypothetical protein